MLLGSVFYVKQETETYVTLKLNSSDSFDCSFPAQNFYWNPVRQFRRWKFQL